MKKILLKLCMIMLLIIPCTFVFSACGKDKDKNPNTEQSQTTPSPEGDSDDESNESEVVVTLEGIDVEVSDEHDFDYDEETNTITFVYGDEMLFEKDSFVVSANYSNESNVVVTGYEIDSSELEENPDVGNYVLKFTFEEKTANINVKIEPKPIAKLVNNWGSSRTFIFNEINGEPEEYSVVIEGFDENTMEYSVGSTYRASAVGNYFVEVKPKSNYVWEANSESQEESNADAIRFDWVIEKRQLFTKGPETLEFVYEEGEVRELVFVDFSEFFKFDDYFEIVDGSVSAEDVGNYTVTVAIKEDKIENYYINDIEYEEGIDFEYNADRTQITYTWKIV